MRGGNRRAGMVQNFNEELFQNAMDLNETIVYEYDIPNDTMSFADNVTKYMPCSLRIPMYLEELQMRGKVHHDDIRKAISFFRGGTDDTSIRMEYLRFMNFNGDYPWYQVKGRIILDEEQKPKLLYGTYTCVDGDSYLSDELNDRNTKDTLTKLYNRENIAIKINEYIDTMPEGVIPGIMLIHVSNYKEICERNGDQIGEGTLIETSRILKRALRAADLIGRFSDDTFIVCMKGVRDERVYCERAAFILDSLKLVWADPQKETKIAGDIGIAIACDKDEMSFSELLDKASKSLVSASQRSGSTYFLYTDRLYGEENFKNIRVSGHEIELVKKILDPMISWAYAADENYNLIYKNKVLDSRIPGECEGPCYAKLKGYSEPCPDCPMQQMKERTTSLDSVVYSPSLRAAMNMRTNRIIMRNGMKVFVMANVKDDLEQQMKRLSDSTAHFRDAILKVDDIVWEINLTKNSCVRVREANVLTLQERRIEDYQTLRNYYLDNVVHFEDREAFLHATDPARLREARKMGREVVHKEVRLLQQDDTYKWYLFNSIMEAGINENGEERVFLIAKDIQKLKQSIIDKFVVDSKFDEMMKRSEFQKEIAQSNERYEHVNELTGIIVFEYDVPTNRYYTCTTFEDIFECTPGMYQNEWSMLLGLRPFYQDEKKYENFIKLIQTEPDTHETTLRLYNRFGVPVWFTITVQTLKGMNNVLTRVLGILQNVNTEMEIKAELEFRADYDSITSLYNSEAFYSRCLEQITTNKGTNYAIISVDIDRFRLINDRFGIDVGNRCLEFLGRVIRTSIAWDGVAGRYQGDVFSILYAYHKEQDIIDYMEGLNNQFTFPEAAKCGSTLSFGIYKILDTDIPIRLMCDRARLAKKEIKGNALRNYAVYDDVIRLQMREQAEIESEMQAALDHHEFVMYLQPKYDLRTEKICGAEALVRWIHPTRGIRMPGDFLPLFENNGFVKKLDEYMWESAARYLSALQERGINLPISVNISRLHVNTTRLREVLTKLTDKYSILPGTLELEITENLFMEDVNELYATMMELKNAGFVIEMDDFGSGYSSLNMLRSAPVDVIKIDRFFLDEIMSTKRGRIIVENSIVMSKQLGMTVVAEGVETREQVDFLQSAGCDIAQGYYYSKPITVEEFEKLL